MQANYLKKQIKPFVTVVLMMLLVSGQGCGTSKVIGKTYIDDNGYYCLSPELLKTINVAIKNAPKKKVRVTPQ